MTALFNYVINKNIYIILCQDPYILGGSAPGIPPEWLTFFSNTFNAAVIFTNRDIATNSNLVLDNAVFVSLNVNNDKIYMGSQYSSPSDNIDEEFENIGEHFDNVRLAGDFNIPL